MVSVPQGELRDMPTAMIWRWLFGGQRTGMCLSPGIGRLVSDRWQQAVYKFVYSQQGRTTHWEGPGLHQIVCSCWIDLPRLSGGPDWVSLRVLTRIAR